MKKLNFKMPTLVINGIDVIKNALFFVLFLLITLLFVAVIIAPAVKKFKKDKKLYYQTKSEYEVTLDKYKQNLKELNAMKEKNKRVLLNLKRDFSIENFKMFAKKYMQIESIKKDKTEVVKKYFLKTPFKIKASISSPEDFYKFINALEKYKYLLEVEYPIILKKDKKIDIFFTLNFYKLKDKSGN